jgi:hypothetical protein
MMIVCRVGVDLPMTWKRKTSFQILNFISKSHPEDRIHIPCGARAACRLGWWIIARQDMIGTVDALTLGSQNVECRGLHLGL